MPIRNPLPIPYSSPIFYGEGELSYNEQREQLCDFFGSPMCLPWDSTESFCFQFLAGEKGENRLTCLPVISGTATSNSATGVIDNTKSFGDDGLFVGQLILNVTTGDTFCINTIPTAPGDDYLTLDGTSSGPNMFSTGDEYKIFAWVLNTPLEIDNVSINQFSQLCFHDFTGEVRIADFPAINTFHRITVPIVSYTQGELILNREATSNNTIQTYSAPGVFDSWFQTPVTELQLVGNTERPFTGCVDMCNAEVFDLQTEYAYQINDAGWVSFTYLGAALRKGVVEKCIDLPTECDVSVCLGYNYQCGDYQEIGEVGGWYTDIGVGITTEGSNVCFISSMQGDFAYAKEIGCDIDAIVTNIEFELTISGHVNGNVQVCIQNTDLSSEVCSNPHGSNGVHIFTVSNFGMNAGPKRIIIKAHNNNATLCATLRYRIQDFQPDVFACSECYHVKPINCEMKLEWDNDTNAFGHVYTTGYTNTMYLDGRLLNGKITSIAHEERKGVDSYQRSFFSNGRKVEELAIDAVWPAVHQSVAVGLMHRNFYINGVQYVKIGEYEPDYSDDAEIAPCTVEVAKRDQRFIVNPL